MSKLDDLHTLVRLLKEFELPISPILEYAIKEREREIMDSPLESNLETFEVAQEVNADSETTISFTTIKEEYISFVHKIKSAKSANENLQILDGPVRRYINQIVDSNTDSIYSFENLEDFSSCISKLNCDDGYVESNLRRHHKYSGALSVYRRFLEIKEKVL